MSAAFDAMAQGEVAALRARHPGIAVRVHWETRGSGAGADHCVALDIRGPEFQELVSGKPSASMQKAIAAAFGEARERLRAREARGQAPDLLRMRVALACAVPQPAETA